MRVNIIPRIVDKLRRCIAMVEDGDTCTYTNGISANKYVIWKGVLCQASETIGYGDGLTAGKLPAVENGIANDLYTKITSVTSSDIDAPSGITISGNNTKKLLSLVSIVFYASSTEALASGGWRTIGTIHESVFLPQNDINGVAIDDTNGMAIEVRIRSTGSVDVYVDGTHNAGCKRVFVTTSYII